MANKHITDIVQVLTKNGNPEMTTQVRIKSRNNPYSIETIENLFAHKKTYIYNRIVSSANDFCVWI